MVKGAGGGGACNGSSGSYDKSVIRGIKLDRVLITLKGCDGKE